MTSSIKNLGPFANPKDLWRKSGLPWKDLGGESALQALCPLGSLIASEREKMDILVGGTAAHIIGIAALNLNVRNIHVISEAIDKNKENGLTLFPNMKNLKASYTYNRVLIGFAKKTWDAKTCTPWIQRLKPGGQITLFGLAETMLQKAFEDVAKEGFSLRASGRRNQFSFISGTINGNHRPVTFPKNT